MDLTFTISRASLSVIVIVITAFQFNMASATAYTWKGATSSDWNTASNWSPSGVPTTADFVSIGSTTFTNQPTISSFETAYASFITFGTVKTSTLTLNGSLTVPGNIALSGSATFSMSNSAVLTLGGNFSGGTLSFPSSSTAKIIMNGTSAQYFPQTTTLSGNVGYLDIQNSYYGAIGNRGVELLNQVGGTTKVTINYLYVEPNCIFNANATLVEGTGYHATIGADAIYISKSTFNFHDNDVIDPSATLEFTATNQVINMVKPNAGNTNIPPNVIFTGTNITVNAGTSPDNATAFKVLGNFGVLNTTTSVTFDSKFTEIDIGDNFIGTGAMYSGSLPINISGSWLNTANYNVGGVVTYNGSNASDSTQTVATSVTYQNNVVFTGATPKQVASGTMSVAGNLDNSAGTSVDFVTNSSTLLMNGSGTQYIKGGTATNSYYSSNVVTGTIFNNVTISTTGTGAKTILQGNNNISPLGVLTINNPASLDATASNSLTLLSDATGSATFAALPSGSSISGSSVNVQRFVKGSYPTDATRRGYRLLSSTVYTGTAGGYNVWDLTWLANSAIISGPAGGGFFKTGNPSAYIYREDIVPSDANFTTGNYKGIAAINNSPAYNIGTQKRLTITNINDTTVTLPVGNGLLFFFRGNKTTSNGSTAGTKTSLPYNYPESVTFTNTGTLNTGTINVKLWYKQDNYLGYTNSVNLANSAVRGFCLVGNPYASTINWEKFNRNSTVSNSSIYGGGNLVTPIYMFNPTNKQYEVYLQKTGTITSADTTSNINPGLYTGSASNMIASGQAFFILADASNQTLSFRETAKTNTQPETTQLNTLMGVPKGAPVAADPQIRLQMIQDSINMDEIVVQLNDHASTAYSITEDAADIGSLAAAVSLSAISADHVKLAIDQLPFPKRSPQVIPLDVDASTAGAYKLQLTQLSNLSQAYEVILRDNYLQDSAVMRQGTIYSFNIDKSDSSTFADKRFQLVIRPGSLKPLKLVSFDADKIKGASLISWKVKNEYNTTAFYVERSTDKRHTFLPVGSMEANGSGSYSLADKYPAAGEDQYRLKLVDANNDITYSSIVTLFYASASEYAVKLRIFPNPASSSINVYIAKNNNMGDFKIGAYTVKIVNSFGMVVRHGASQEASWQSNISDLQPGTYILQVISQRNNSLIGTGSFVKD
ncbi:MAG: T9SS type A sorting domain-containing protein [Bacteroidetes bacterium]|nr:T9SS type A sorting domain-containing protein [Bacteroidota bacterium]